ncbi:MAG: hypothetical protein PQJ45_00195 [Sphaerochaetaceae bacterium]|nr:hypothetical protein [Sphaerochaetaceae bacterium]
MKFLLNKLAFLTIMILLSLNPLYSLSLTSEVTDAIQIDEMGNGIFPVSFFVTYDVTEFNFIEDYATKMTFDLNGGYDERDVFQDPITGLEDWCDNYDEVENSTYLDSEYGAVFTGWEMKLTQPLPISEKIPGKISAWASVAGHYEQAIEALEIYRDDDPYADITFFSLIAAENDYFYGIPELNGNRYLYDSTLNIGSIYKHKISGISITHELSLKVAPTWFFNNLDYFGGSTSYTRLDSELTLSKSLYKSSYDDFFSDSKFRLFSITIMDELDYRYLNGTAVPMYISDYSNLHHDVNNKLSLNFYGPQIFAKDWYPKLQLYYYTDFRWGKLNNLDPQYDDEYNSGELSNKIGGYIDMRILGIIHFGYQIYYEIEDADLTNEAYFYVEI